MPRGSIQSQIGYERPSDSPSNALQQQKKIEEEKNKAKLEALKRWNKTEQELTAKQKELLEKKNLEIEKKYNKKSLEERKKKYQEDYELAITNQEKFSAKAKEFGINTLQAIGGAAKQTLSAVSDGIGSYLGVYSDYMSGIETRLQGSTRDFASVTKTIKSAVGASPYVKQTAILEKLNQLVSQGISYNVEQRAFLGTVSENIARTFDAANGTLLQLIRIQQADTTAARLGLESSLTKYFNMMFGDTSYLSDTFDAVSSILMQSTSQLTGARGVEYEYAIQKWLGSMASVGVSQSTLQSIATGLNYLGTGDISGLSSNQTLQRLLVTAAGSSYADILTGGLNAENANQILQNIVGFAQQIGNIQNNVLRQQYANLFGFQLSDLTGLMKLTTEDINSITSNMLSYTQMYQETVNQIATIGDRMSLKQKLDTAMSNVMTTMGESIANSTGAYATWLIADIMQKSGADIAIPTFTVMGTGVDLNTTVAGLMKTGLVGYSLLGSLGTLVNTLIKKGQLDIGAWGAEEYTTRGGRTSLRTTGVSSNISSSAFIGDVSTSSLYEGSVAKAKETVSYKADENEDNLETILKQDIAVTLKNIYSLLVNGVKISSDSYYREI